MPLGIPYSVFLDWDPDDQDKALAYMREKAKVCSCGTRMEEWEDIDPMNPPYISWSQVCPGCRALEEERHNLPEDSGAWGAHVFLVKNVPGLDLSGGLGGDFFQEPDTDASQRFDSMPSLEG